MYIYICIYIYIDVYIYMYIYIYVYIYIVNPRLSLGSALILRMYIGCIGSTAQRFNECASLPISTDCCSIGVLSQNPAIHGTLA